MTLLVDNYDSFSYNLYQLVGQFDEVKVVRNDAYTPREIEDLNPDLIVISPGPGKPSEAGVCVDLVRHFFVDKMAKISPPIFGVCLGHQAICEAFGAKVSYAKKLMHGKSSEIEILGTSTLFDGFGKSTQVARYHSLAALDETLPSCLKVTSRSNDGEVMSVQHETLPIFGVQFHPESVMTPQGFLMLRNLYEVLR